MTRTAQTPGSETTEQRRGRRGRDRRGAEAFVDSPFRRLARTHALSVAGDALLAIALADSLFFAVDPNDARWRVGAYLLLTLAPFAVVAPFLGPVMDRITGGHRFMIIGTALIRAGLMAALVVYVQRWPLFPLAFGMLVMGKTYAVAKSAVVPTTVTDESELVRFNSRLSILSAVAGAAAGIPGILLLRLGGAPWVLGLGVLVFLAAAVAGSMVPATQVAAGPAEQEEKAELRASGIVLASSAMGYLRGGSGFITMLLAFDLRGGIDPGPTSAGVEIGHQVRQSLGLERLDLATGGAPPWHFGVALIGVGVGGLIGAGGVPRLRNWLAEERILAFALIALTIMALLAAISTGLAGAFLMAAGIALALQGGKQAFDALVQREAPRANLGRTFSRFESRFQLIWVLGALIPVVVPLPARVGYIMMATTAIFVSATYWFGRTPNPAAIVSDGVVDDGLDRLAEALPGSLGRRMPGRERRRSDGSIEPAGAPDETIPMDTPDATREMATPDSTRRMSRPDSGGELVVPERSPGPVRSEESFFGDGQTRGSTGSHDPQNETQIFADGPPTRPPVVRPRSGQDRPAEEGGRRKRRRRRRD